MKKFLLVACTTILALGGLAQTPSSCTPSAALLAAYHNDARDLAVGRMYAIGSPDTSLVWIPSIHSDSILRGIAAIANTGSALQADSVFDAYCIHTYPNGFIQNSLEVVVDTSYAWARQWEAGHNVTGNAELDQFTARYGFLLSGWESAMNIAVINTDSALNSTAFADSLNLFAGVLAVYPNNPHVGTNGWMVYRHGALDTFTFTYGWGDCMSGCISQKTWVYTVDGSCNVQLLSVTASVADGYSVPPYCNVLGLGSVAPREYADAQFTPNPAYGKVRIDWRQSGTIIFCITNLTGEQVGAGVVQAGASIDLTALPAGAYIATLTDAGGATTHKRLVKL